MTHPSAAPDNHLLTVWSPGPVNGGYTVHVPAVDGGLYLIKDGKPIDEPAQMLLIKNDPKFNEQWPRALVPYQRIYGVDEPKPCRHCATTASCRRTCRLTADANSRLAYGTGALSGTCTPGTGGTAGTGNQNGTHTDTPCTLNPAVVLRAGTTPVQRPNGSGAGFNLLKQDTDSSGNGLGYVDFSRASSARTGGAFFDSITVGQDPLAILSRTGGNAVALSAAQLNSIYSCSVTTWDDPSIGGASSATIKPLIPQVGSGTRSSFLSAIGSPTLGGCVTAVEENDPEAIDASSSPANAIEPMSGGRLNLYLGKLANGNPNGVGGYFTDPSCPFPPSESTTPTACTTGSTLTPNVKFWDTGTPHSGTLFDISRPLYLYFRHSDINSPKVFQPGGTLNWVRTMFYNPCSGTGHTTGCVTVGGVQYGPGGPPVFAQGSYQSNISAAGVTPTYAYTPGGP